MDNNRNDMGERERMERMEMELQRKMDEERREMGERERQNPFLVSVFGILPLSAVSGGLLPVEELCACPPPFSPRIRLLRPGEMCPFSTKGGVAS